jgi:hypothetical protein
MFHSLHSDDALIHVASQMLDPGSLQEREVNSKVMSDYDVLVRCFQKFIVVSSSPNPVTPNEDGVLYRALMRILDEVRYGMDRERPEALRAWSQAQDHIIERAHEGVVDDGLVYRLLKLFQWAQMKVKPELKTALSGVVNDLDTLTLRKDDVLALSEGPASLRMMMRGLAKEARGNSISLYIDTIDLFAFFSDEIISHVASAFVRSDIGIFRDTGILALLCPSVTVRQSVLSAVRADIANMTPVNLRRLGLLRPWLTTPGERNEVAMLLEDAHERGLKPEPMKPVRMDRTYASILDGSGCQGVSAASLQGKTGGLFSFLSKIGFGIRSGIYETGVSSRDLEANERRIKKMSQPVSREFVDAFACNALAESHLAGNTIPVEFVGVAEAFGANNWSPDPTVIDTLRETLLSRVGSIDFDGALNRTETLSQEERFSSWFEDGAFVDEALAADIQKRAKAQGGPDGIVKDLIEGKFERRREQWRRMFFWSAASDALSKKPKGTGWEDRFIVSEALRAGRPLSEIPFFQLMAQFSLSQASMRLMSTFMEHEG